MKVPVSCFSEYFAPIGVTAKLVKIKESERQAFNEAAVRIRQDARYRFQKSRERAAKFIFNA